MAKVELSIFYSYLDKRKNIKYEVFNRIFIYIAYIGIIIHIGIRYQL